jgi:para-nitrobenzyl esterase
MRRSLSAAIAALLAPIAATPAYAVRRQLASPAVETLAHTENGLVKGVSGTGYRVFDGVPYAAPPTGPNRWRAPQPAADWRGVRDATELPAECAQNPVIKGGPVVGAEDCLYVKRDSTRSRDRQAPGAGLSARRLVHRRFRRPVRPAPPRRRR